MAFLDPNWSPGLLELPLPSNERAPHVKGKAVVPKPSRATGFGGQPTSICPGGYHVGPQVGYGWLGLS